jgi:hypothetical protein
MDILTSDVFGLSGAKIGYHISDIGGFTKLAHGDSGLDPIEKRPCLRLSIDDTEGDGISGNSDSSSFKCGSLG